MGVKPAIEYDHLADHRNPDGCDAGQHCDGRTKLKAQCEGAGGEADDERLADDELRHQAEAHPVMGARDTILRVGDDEGRQRQAAEIERHHRVGVDPRRDEFDEASEQQRDYHRDDTGHPAAAREEAAQPRVVAAGAIFRDDLLG
jgi:hypothetical protein